GLQQAKDQLLFLKRGISRQVEITREVAQLDHGLRFKVGDTHTHNTSRWAWPATDRRLRGARTPGGVTPDLLSERQRYCMLDVALQRRPRRGRWVAHSGARYGERGPAGALRRC